jgi:hypothetical protein
MDIKIYKGNQEREIHNIDLEEWRALGWITGPTTPAVIPAPIPKPAPIEAPIEKPARRRGRPSRK